MDILYYKNVDPLSVDYYGILELCRDCDAEHIRKAFRRLAINLHPERDRDADPCNLDAENRRALFALVAEAYDVLSKPLFKSVYDEFGAKGLREGTTDSKTGKRVKPYVYHGEPLRTYREFFGTDNPYVDLLDNLKVPDEENTTVIPKRKAEPVIEPLELTLSELFFGGIKKKCYDGKMLSIAIMPGLPTHTRIVFPDFVDGDPSMENADLIFVTTEEKHETFRRDDANLIMRVRITLKEALCGTTLTINTIDDRVLRIPITSIVRPRDTKTILGEGMPLVEDPQRRGHLVLAFEIEFPETNLTPASRGLIARALDLDREARRTEDRRQKSNLRRMVMAGKVYERKEICKQKMKYEDLEECDE
ncbi:hypothetical protein TKK_0005746 [Trichogramma kaykai]